MLDSQWVAQQIGRPVIKAFNNIFAKSLLEKAPGPFPVVPRLKDKPHQDQPFVAHGAAGDLALLPDLAESAEPLRGERSEARMGSGPLGVESLVGDRTDGPVK